MCQLKTLLASESLPDYANVVKAWDIAHFIEPLRPQLPPASPSKAVCAFTPYPTHSKTSRPLVTRTGTRQRLGLRWLAGNGADTAFPKGQMPAFNLPKRFGAVNFIA